MLYQTFLSTDTNKPTRDDMITIRIIDVVGPAPYDLVLEVRTKTLWLKSHRDTPDGRGKTVLTESKNEAMTFTSIQEALLFYRQQSKFVPLRDDGGANRPLTAYTVDIG